MNNYEFIILTRPSLDKEKLEKLFKEVIEEIEKISGKVSKKEELGKKTLAYPIKKETKALFWVWQLEFEKSPKFSNLNTFLNRSSGIIRYLMLKR